MYTIPLLFGIIVICTLLCIAELIVRIWMHAERHSHPARPVIRTQTPPKIVPLTPAVCLPDRNAIKNMSCLADQFVDHFREVMNS